MWPPCRVHAWYQSGTEMSGGRRGGGLDVDFTITHSTRHHTTALCSRLVGGGQGPTSTAGRRLPAICVSSSPPRRAGGIGLRGDEMSFSIRAITSRLAAARDTAKVIAVAGEHKEELDDIAVSTALAQLARLARRSSLHHGGYLQQPQAAAVMSHLEQRVLDSAQRPSRSGRTLSSSLHSLAILRRPRALQELQGTIPGLLGTWGPRDTSTLLWAYATSRAAFPGGAVGVFEAAAETMQRQLDSASPQDISNALWACAACRHCDSALFRSAATCARAALPHFRPLELSNTLWAFASNAELSDLGLFRDVQSRAVRSPGGFKPQEAANLLWSFAVADVLDGNLLSQLVPALGPPSGLDDRAGRALLMAWLAAQNTNTGDDGGRRSRRGEHDLGGELMEAIERAWSRRDANVPSAIQQDVARVIRFLGPTASLEAPLSGGYLAADILVAYRDGRRVAVEVDGPTHFSSNLPHRRLGAYYLREGLLKAHVTAVVTVPFFEWDRLPGDSAKLHYMAAKLRGCQS